MLYPAAVSSVIKFAEDTILLVPENCDILKDKYRHVCKWAES